MAGKSKAVLPVHGMSCASCVANVEKTVKGLSDHDHHHAHSYTPGQEKTPVEWRKYI